MTRSMKNSLGPLSKSHTKRIDQLEQYYKPVETIDDWISFLFWFSAAASVLILFEKQIPWFYLRDVPEVLFLVSVLIQLLLSMYLRFNILPQAETKRRRQLLSDSLGVALTSERTQGYYNNVLAPSLTRLGANVLENAYFAKAISAKMVVRERVRISIYFAIWLMAVFWRNTDLGLVAIITQTLFSSEIIEKWLRLELLRYKNENFYDELYLKFLHKVDFADSSVIASILDIFASYEVAKGIAGIRLSGSIFSSLNPKLSAEWDSIRKQLAIDQLRPESGPRGKSSRTKWPPEHQND